MELIPFPNDNSTWVTLRSQTLGKAPIGWRPGRVPLAEAEEPEQEPGIGPVRRIRLAVLAQLTGKDGGVQEVGEGEGIEARESGDEPGRFRCVGDGEVGFSRSILDGGWKTAAHGFAEQTAGRSGGQAGEGGYGEDEREEGGIEQGGEERDPAAAKCRPLHPVDGVEMGPPGAVAPEALLEMGSRERREGIGGGLFGEPSKAGAAEG